MLDVVKLMTTTSGTALLTCEGHGGNPRPDPQSRPQTCGHKRAEGRKSSSYKDSDIRKETARSYSIDLQGY